MRGGGAHIFFPLCESVQLISLWARCDSAWNRSTAVGGELKCEHKRSPFCDWISVHSVRTIKFTIGGGTTCGLELISGVQRVYRVCIVHEIVGVGGLFEWGGLARELRTLMEVLALVLAPRGWAVKARYEKPLCAKYIHNIHCTALKSWMWKYPDLTDKNFPCV